MLGRQRQPTSTLDDVVELLSGIGRTLMEIGANLEDVIRLLRRDDDEEADT
jgi:hypothetical protein